MGDQQNALTEMTKAIREREPSSLPLYKVYTLVRLHYTQERNLQHRRADYLDLKKETGEPAADVCLETNLRSGKKCEFENVTAAELLASEFQSLIGKSAEDNELKKKIRKNDMSIKAITEAIHEYMYEKVKESPKAEEKKLRHAEKRK